MMGMSLDLNGQRFGLLTAIRHTNEKRHRNIIWEFKCDCGKTVFSTATSVKNGHTKSCGCVRQQKLIARSTKHGHAKRSNLSRAYSIWSGMKNRCLNPNEPALPRYGGRGIEVCDRWLNSFEAFLSDMGEPPSKSHSIDRIDNDGNYEPINCRWVTANEQTRNTRQNHWLTIDGETKCIADWSLVSGVSAKIIGRRIKDFHWDAKRAVFEQPTPRKTYFVTHEGKTQSLYAWSKETGIKFTTLLQRHQKGWTGEKLFASTMKN